MKNFSDFRFTVKLILGIVIIVIFTSYGNIVVHPSINEMSVQAFLDKNQPKPQATELKNYSFIFDMPKQSMGSAITSGGKFDVVEEGSVEKSVTEWIIHGGYAADEPEVPASLRHFYDPTTTPGLRHLLDITNHKLMGLLQLLLTSPNIDGVDWALGKPRELAFADPDKKNHLFTWENGKVWMRMALQQKKEEKRNELMGKAWRALGETLHMIADNGCPAHVRNDAHPSPIWGNNSILGNPDPYEELMDYVRYYERDKFNNFAQGAPDPDLQNQITKMTRARDIAHALAIFTNKNFVTNETISGINTYGNQKNQIINSEDPYKAPLLENMTYNEEDYTYSYRGAKQCIDHEYFWKLIPRMCEPKVDMKCVKSQAAILIPNVIAASTKVIELFIPKLKVEILSATDSLVKGMVTHLKDAEYSTEIKYLGEATLFLKHAKTNKKEEIKVNVTNGMFEASRLNLEQGDLVYARIEFSDQSIMIDSEVVKLAIVEKNNTVYTIGQKYGGGIIYYIDGTGQHGLIAAPSDQSVSAAWGCMRTLIDLPKNVINDDGQVLTDAIVKQCNEEGTAARICYDLVLNGYSDWYLPSNHELFQIISVINDERIIPYFVNDEKISYWTSSQTDYQHATFSGRWGGSWGTNEASKESKLHVRAIRAF